MKLIETLKAKAHAVKRDLTALYYASRDPRVGWWPKFLLGAALAYALSPIDLIPDFIPVLGQLDDLIIVPALLAWALRSIPADLLAEARRRAEEEPLHLPANWFAAGAFILFWIVVIGVILLPIFLR
jgi:uncharacterized membrane protein YkvA (DUF1232 family)